MSSLVPLFIVSFILFFVLPIVLMIWIGRYTIRKLTGQNPEALLRATRKSVSGWVDER